MMMMMNDRAILREIQWLRLQQQQQQLSSSPCSSGGDHAPSLQLVPSSQSAQQLALGHPGQLVDELRLLRRRRDALECRMVSLQSSRRQLISQLDSLMNLLKASLAYTHRLNCRTLGRDGSVQSHSCCYNPPQFTGGVG